jgi:hypothetical protein
MNSISKELFFFSTEGWSSELPLKCHFVKQLKTKNQREAILVKCEEKITRYGTNYLVLVPKHIASSFFQIDGQPVFAYVIHGSQYINSDEIDLSLNNKMILDWGGVAVSYEKALIWQCEQ